MKNHINIYMNFFGYDESDIIFSEISGQPATDIHHIEARGMGGSKKKDNINNLIALTREEHIQFGDKKQFKEYLQGIHNKKIIEKLKTL